MISTKTHNTPTTYQDSQQDALHNKATSLDLSTTASHTACYMPLCDKPVKREDKHHRTWCLSHAPQGAWLAPGVKSFLEGTEWEKGKDSKDARYKDCKWYNIKKQDGPASQCLDFALHRDYRVLGLCWYTDELIKMFKDNPVQAKRWAMQVEDAYVSGNTLRLEMLSKIVNAVSANTRISKEDTTQCYICGQTVYNLDLHGRAYCFQHYPSDVDNSQELSTIVESVSVEMCSGCGNEAEGYYSATSGAELCKQCWSKEG